MRLHRNVAEGIISTLGDIFEHQKVAERAVAATLQRHPKWGSRDRSLLAELTYDIVRWRRRLAFAANCDEGDNWKLLSVEAIRRGVEAPSLPAETLRVTEVQAGWEEGGMSRAVRESIPDWLDELGEQELGERWGAEIAALNGVAPVVLRANTLKTTRDDLQMSLLDDAVPTRVVEALPDALQLHERQTLARQLTVGSFEVQDAASQLVAPLLRVEPGLTVVDACAGAGGKTLHLGALMQNQGRILAFDVEKRRLDELDRRARRAGLSIVRSALPPKQRQSDFADRLLVDAPCSGLGTLRRQPDLKWRLTPEFLAQLQAKQRQILSFYAPMLKKGGLMVYATCSVLPSENERQVEWFLAQHTSFELVEHRSILCCETGFDGFFMALLRKREE